ncbi:FAD-binding oxidoreductase [Marinobacter orientalis]|uniref:FAD-binding oxidoreductase n=1 Tax=Marinobacter orientalis TaxID=1928859 RepID=A0A7Y0RAD4_9GAMM|nr:FAD-binding oxidoreductase [Marinobacter orientalis]NMT62774.1 FAD-binding oxidoreductase [Marinobacter orientalis]TGX51453.1 FAD-binding oxidoreductase [Marinobacter orientalis]
MTLRNFWGWGNEDKAFDDRQISQLRQLVGLQFGDAELACQALPVLADLDMPDCRLQPPASLAPMISSDRRDRASHTYGKSFRDIVRGLAGDYRCAPDLIARPSTEQELLDVLDYASSIGAAVIPYGGGSSVVGGTEPRYEGNWKGTVTVDMERFNRIIEVDHQSRAAHIEGGIYGPALEDGLRPHGYTLRHFPQSFEFSTLGGWIATRSGGHFATLYTHIDELVESTRVVTPRGALETRRLPGSGAGPSPDRLFLGSEGILGFVTSAWMRVQERPQFRATRTVHFGEFLQGAEAVRRLSQSGLYPTNCRLIDAREAMINGIENGSKHLLIVGFESADHPVDGWMERALEIVTDAGGAVQANRQQKPDKDQAGDWRQQFIRAPYMRDGLIRLGLVAETFETAITWDRFEDFHRGVSETVNRVTREICGKALVTCRFTHVYPDGPAPYYTVIAPGRHGDQVKQWDEIKLAVMETLIDLGGTITHHHAVGRDHRWGYDRQRPELFAEVLKATKKTLDPGGMLNPGVLI